MRQFAGSELVIATHNDGKLAEFIAIFAEHDVKLTSAKALNLPSPEETENTFIGNAKIKAHDAAQASGLPALADDSGIVVDGLDGAPGVYTADWAETAHGRDFEMAMRRTWDALEACNAGYPRTARFCSTLVLAWPDGHDEVFEGVVEGQVVWPMRGVQGHGYDPMFQPEGHDKTFAEMPESTKNAISHRARAFEKLIAGCFANR